MEKLYLSHMTAPEVKEKSEEKRVVFVPVGTTETQSRHNPIGYDYLIAQYLSEEAAKKCGAVIAPVIPYGYSEVFKEYSGTISLRPETLQNLLYDITESLVKHGFGHIIFIDNHAGNTPILNHALARIREKHGLVFPSVFPSELAKIYARELFSEPNKVLMHGNEPSTSLCSYLCPEYMRMDMAVESPDWSDSGNFGPFKYGSPGTLEYKGYKVPFHTKISDTSVNGGFGNPKGDAEIGKKIFERMVNYLVGFAIEFQKTDNLFDK